MAKNEAKIRFSAETSEFNNQIKQSNAEMSKLRAEMKLNDEQMKTAGTSVEGLQQKQKLLENQLAASQQKTEALSQKVQAAKDIYGENSLEVKKLETQLLAAQTAEERLQRQLSTCNDELESQRAAAERTETATEQLNKTIQEQQQDLNKLKDEYKEAVLKFGATSEEANELAGKIDTLSGELKENKRTMADAASAADDLDNSLDNASDNDGSGFTVFKGALANLISNGIQFAIGKVNELVDYMWGLPEATREIRQDFATLTTAFDNMGYSTEVATETWKGLYGVFGEDDRAVETANNIAKIAANEEDLNKWVTITTGIWGTYQDSLPVEGLAEAANETAKVGTVTGGLADALNWSSEAATMFASYMSEDVVTAEDAFNEALKECNTEQERQRLITDTLTALYGGAAETYRETSGAMLEAKEATAENIIAENNLATAIEPVTTKWNEMTNQLKTALLPAAEKVSEWAVGALDWMQEHPKLMTVIATTIGIFATALSGLAIGWGVYTAAQWLANSAMLACPLTWIVAAIAAVIAAIVAIVVYWDEIVGFFKGLWDAIVGVFKSIIDWVKENWESIILFIINPFAGIFKYLWDNCETFRDFVTNIVKKTWDAITKVLSKVGNWINDKIIKPVVKYFEDLWKKITNGVKNAWKSATDLLSKVAGWVNDKIIKPVADYFTNLWKGIVNAYHTVIDPWIEIFKRLATIVYDSIIVPIGKYFTDLWNGVVNAWKTAWTALTESFKTVASWVNTNVVTPVANFFVGLWNGFKDGATNAWNAICEVFKTIGEWINTNVVTPVVGFFIGLWNGFKDGATNAWNAIKEVFNTIGNWINTNVVSPVSNFFVNLWSGFKSKASEAWEGVKSVFGNVASFFKDTFERAWTAVKNVFSTGGQIFSGIKDGILTAFKAVVNTIIKGINTVVSVPFNGLNTLLNKLQNTEIAGIKPFAWITWRSPIPQIPLLAEGGILTKPTLNIAGEAGPEAIIPIDKLQSYISGSIEKTMQIVDMQSLVYAIEDLASRAIELHVNGHKFAVATAGDTDVVNGSRMQLSKRGLAR